MSKSNIDNFYDISTNFLPIFNYWFELWTFQIEYSNIEALQHGTAERSLVKHPTFQIVAWIISTKRQIFQNGKHGTIRYTRSAWIAAKPWLTIIKTSSKSYLRLYSSLCRYSYVEIPAKKPTGIIAHRMTFAESRISRAMKLTKRLGEPYEGEKSRT